MDRFTVLHALLLALAVTAFMSIASAEDAKIPVKARIIECGIAETLYESCRREPLCCAFLEMEKAYNDKNTTLNDGGIDASKSRLKADREPFGADIYRLDYVFE